MHSVEYVSYIPIDNVVGPSPCFFYGVPIVKTYKGDGVDALTNGYPPQSWRTSSFFAFKISTHQEWAFRKDPMQTRNYGFGSPATGGVLTSADEDYVPNDCYLWNAASLSDNSSWQHAIWYPSSTKARVRYWGEAANPLEPVSAPIGWDFETEVNISNLDYVTAKVNQYEHTCYPAHAITVNEEIVYQYLPNRNDTFYISNCLLFQLDKVSGSQAWSTHVPCN